MSDFYSEDEDTTREPEPMVVEVRGHSTRESPLTVHRSPRRQASSRNSHRRTNRNHDYSDESDDEDLYDDGDFDDDDDDEYTEVNVQTARSTARQRRSARQMKTTNGKKSVNMMPPDKLLEKSVRMAKKLSAARKADRAVQERIKILALARIVYGSVHWKLAEAHLNLAEDYLELKGYNAQAEYHTENAMTIMLNSVTTTTTEREKADVFGVLFRINYIQGKAQTAMKKYSEADAALAKADRAYQACSKLSCVTDEQCDEMEIQLTQACARLSWRQKKYAVAGSQYDKVIDLTKRLYGEDAIELIQIYQEGGRLEQSKGKQANHDKAIEMFLQAHSIAAANYKYASEEIVDTALVLAQAYASTGREEAESSAESYLNECLTSCTTVYGPDHKKTLEVQDELARLLIRTEREVDALEMLRSSLPLKDEVYGEYSEVVSDTHKLIASVHLAQGNIEKSLRAYKKCLNIEVIVLGKNHKKTKDTERTIDILMASPGLSKKFILNKEDELKKRPRFNNFSKSAKTAR